MRRSLHSTALVAALIALAGCGGGGGGAAGGSLATDIGVFTADYLVLDLATGTIVTRSAISDLATNATYRTTKMVFKAVQSGASPVGSGLSAFGHQPDEVAATPSVTKYYIGVFEVTQGQWQRLASGVAWPVLPGATYPWDAASAHYATAGGAASADPEKPAYGVTLGVLQTAIVQWNGRHTMKLAVPTETQWEHACRGGATTDFAWGDQRDEATVAVNAAVFETQNGVTGPRRVGSLAANGYGLFDLHGNVWEWTLVTTSTGRVRGGSWNDMLSAARCANKADLDELTVHALVGARLVLVP